MQDLIQQAIDNAVESIKQLQDMGWSKQNAITQVRKSSVLGTKSWLEVLERAEHGKLVKA